MPDDTVLYYVMYLTGSVFTGLLSGAMLYFYRQYGHRYLRHWAYSWAAYAVYLLTAAASVHFVQVLPAIHPGRFLVGWTAITCAYFHTVWLMVGALALAFQRQLRTRTVYAWLAGAWLLALALMLPGLGLQEPGC